LRVCHIWNQRTWYRIPLQFAIEKGLDIVAANLIARCSVAVLETRDSLGHTAVDFAAGTGNKKILQTILDRDPDLGIKSHIVTSLLHHACAAPGDPVEIVKNLFDRLPHTGWYVANKSLETPLHYAAAEGNAQIVTHLIRKKNDPNVENSMGVTPLMLAASRGHGSTIQSLVLGGAKLETKTANGSALFYACWYGNVEAV
jgi:ankyrin repeat protein